MRPSRTGRIAGGPRLRRARLPLRAGHAPARCATPARGSCRRRTSVGLRRRTRAMNGRCQGFYCAAAAPRALRRAQRRSSRPAWRDSSREQARSRSTSSSWELGPPGLSAAIELRRQGRGAGRRGGPRASGRGHPPPQRPPGLRAAATCTARSTGRAYAARLIERGARGGRRAASGEHRHRDRRDGQLR